MLNKNRGADWHSSKVPKCELKTQKTASSQREIPIRENMNMQSGNKKSFMFLSNVPKLNYLNQAIKGRQDVPGPGQYIEQSYFPLVFPRIDYRNILNIGTSKQPLKYSKIGPGSYETNSNKHYKARGTYKAPFDTTQPRFRNYLGTCKETFNRSPADDMLELNRKIERKIVSAITNNNEDSNIETNVQSWSTKHLNKVLEVYKNILNKGNDSK